MSAPVNSNAVAYPRPVAPVALTTSVQTLYTAPNYTTNVQSPAATASVKEIFVANTTGGVVNVTLYKVPNGGSASTGNAILYSVAVNPDDTKLLFGTELFLGQGDMLQASASSAGITLTPSVVEFQ